MPSPWYIIDAASAVHSWPKRILAHLRAWAVQHGGRVVESIEIDAGRWQQDLADPDRVIAVAVFGGLPDSLSDRFPAVLCFNLSANHRADGMVHVLSDNHAAGRVAAQHLLEQGLRHFVVHGRGAIAEQDRRDGFASEVAARGYECIWQPVLARAYRIEDLPDVGGERLGMLCTGDDLAARVCEDLSASGYRIPEDIAVVSIEDLESRSNP